MRFMAYVREGYDLHHAEKLVTRCGGIDAYVSSHTSGHISFNASEAVAEAVRGERCIVAVIEDIPIRVARESNRTCAPAYDD